MSGGANAWQGECRVGGKAKHRTAVGHRQAMNIRMAHHWNQIQSSFWFIPSTMGLAAGLLSVVALWLDRMLEPDTLRSAPLLYQGGPEGATAVLSTIAGSVIGVTGVVFSVTVVALTFASAQFGPRLLRNFMRDTSSKIVLGTFIATFVFSLLGLGSVGRPETLNSVPGVTVSVAILLAFASLAMLIHFIHHIAVSMRAEVIIAGVAQELDASIDHLYPEELGEPHQADAPSRRLPEGFDEEAVPLRASTSGYLQAVDEERVLRLAVEHDLVLRLHQRPGDWVLQGDRLVSIWPPDRGLELARTPLLELFILGRKRTPEQDVEFSLNQLVEIAGRVLSPGINDPFTAIVCVDRIGGALCRLAGRKMPTPYRTDANGKLRVVARRSDLEGFIAAALDPVREMAQSSVPVTIRLLDTICAVGSHGHIRDSARRALQRQADKILAGARRADFLPADLEAVEQRHARAQRALAAA